MLMIEDWILSLVYTLWLAASTVPLGFMLGASCSPCCPRVVCTNLNISRPQTDPKDEGTWSPSGTWIGVGGVTYTFEANQGDESGETWFFFGSAGTSGPGGLSATTAQQQDWGNICNWYSRKSTAPNANGGREPLASLTARATRLPPETAVVHIYSAIRTNGPRTVKNAYFWWNARLTGASTLTTTSPAHDSVGGTVFTTVTTSGVFSGNEDGSVINNGATFNGRYQNQGIGTTVNGGAVFNRGAQNSSGATVNGGARFFGGGSFETGNGSATVNDGAAFDGARNTGTVNGSASFLNSSNEAYVNGGAIFNGNSLNYFEVRGGAVFRDVSRNVDAGIVFDGAAFNDSSFNSAIVEGGATFSQDSQNRAVVNGGATFNDRAKHIVVAGVPARVNGGATFNDSACSEYRIGEQFPTCTRKFVAHPTDLPTCNGSAPKACDSTSNTCGCG